MRFFLDNCLCPRFAPALNALDTANKVKHLRDLFSPDVKDPVWLNELGQQGDWVIVSGDARIQKIPQNRQAWKASGLTTFFLKPTWMNQTLWEQAWRLVR